MDGSAQSPQEMFGSFVQIGVVVGDLDQSMAHLSEIFGIGPFRVTDWPPAGREMNRVYYGEPGDFTARMAFTELGPIELELIQPLTGSSIWSDFLAQRGPGIHHIRFNVPEVGPVVDYLAGHDIAVSQQASGLRPGTVWANFTTEDLIGFTIEIMKVVPGASGRTPRIVDGKAVDDGTSPMPRRAAERLLARP